MSLRLVLKSTPGLAGPESCVSSSRCRCQTTPSVGAQIRPIAPIAGEVDPRESQTGPSTKLGSLPGRRVAAVAAPGSVGFAPLCKASCSAVCHGSCRMSRAHVAVAWRLGPLTLRLVVTWRLGPLTSSRRVAKPVRSAPACLVAWRLGPLTLSHHTVAIRSAHGTCTCRHDS